MNFQQPNITQSCRSCRRLKRRCTKEWPKCSLCTRVGRACEYPEVLEPRRRRWSSRVESSPPNRPANDHENGNDGVLPTPETATANARHQSNDMPAFQPYHAAWFLDSVAMRGRQHLFEQPDLDWSDLAMTYPAMDHVEILEVLDTYRRTTHEWFPVTSLKRLSRQLVDESTSIPADRMAMLYAMRLLSSPLGSHSKHDYSAVKAAIDSFENRRPTTTNLLAAQILLTMYELGQGLFPAAYHSVSRCSRMCYAVGLHDKKKATQLLNKADSWTEVEERRRLWWAILIMDRFVHAGFRFRTLMVPTIPSNEIIPADDGAWDEGQMAVNPLLVMSIEAATVVSPYARLCQAAHLLGSVCQHVNEHPIAEEADFHFQEAHRLSRAISALLTMLEGESTSVYAVQKFFSSRALCYTALLLLYDVHSCIEVDEVESCGGNRGLRLDLQQLALDGMQDIAARVHVFAKEIDSYIQSNDPELVGISPLILNCCYNAAGVYAWYARERGDEDDLKKVSDFRSLLLTFQKRWVAAGKCFVFSIYLPRTLSLLILYKNRICSYLKAPKIHTMEHAINDFVPIERNSEDM